MKVLVCILLDYLERSRKKSILLITEFNVLRYVLIECIKCILINRKSNLCVHVSHKYVRIINMITTTVFKIYKICPKNAFIKFHKRDKK